jgi:uncharacterized membrane protein YfcA
MSSIVLSIFLLSIGASFIQRTTGFGFGIFIMTMLPFFMPSYGEATTLSGLLAITTSAAIVWRLRSYVTWQRLWSILLTFIIVSSIAIFALTRIEDHILRRILGVALILISIYFMLFSQRIKLPTTKKVQVGAGTLSGLMGGFFGMQGPPAVLYFIQSEPTKDHYMAMAQTYFLIGNVMMTGVRAYNGFLTMAVAVDYFYGFGGVISYKKIDLNFFFQGVGDVYRVIGGQPYFLPGGGTTTEGNAYSYNIDDRWTDDNPDPYAFWPRLTYGPNQNNYRSSTWWKKNMSFLRCKTIEVGYTLPKAWVEHIYAKNCRVYVSGNNLFCFSGFKLWDPELGTSNGLQYPLNRSVMFGLDISF